MRRLVVLPVATAIAATGLVVATATGASAHVPKVDDKCGELMVNLTRYRDHYTKANTVTVTVDGEVIDQNPDFGTDFQASYELTKYEDHSYVVQVVAWDDPDSDGDGNGPNGWTRKFTGDIAACQTLVTPRVTKTEPTCQNPNLTLTGVPWIGVTWEPRFVVIPPGQSGTVTAILDDTRILAPGAQTVFTETNTFNPDDCFVPQKMPRGHIKCGCKGDPSGVLNNSRSNVAVSYVAKATLNGHVVFKQVVKVRAGQVRSYSFGGHKKFKPDTKLVLRSNGHVLDRLKVGPRCPQPPHSGLPKVVVPKA